MKWLVHVNEDLTEAPAGLRKLPGRVLWQTHCPHANVMDVAGAPGLMSISVGAVCGTAVQELLL